MSVTETGTRAREPDERGYATATDGLRLYWELHGSGSPTIVLLPPCPISHSRTWKAQLHYLARHHRVVVYDGRGNGNSDTPDTSGPWLDGCRNRSAATSSRSVPGSETTRPELRMILVAGPRLDAGSLPHGDGLETHGYVHRLYRQLAACDLAITHGGLSTTMELTASGRPSLYFPLRREPRYLPVEQHGAARAAQTISELL